MRDNLRAETADIEALKLRATNMRRHILKMARGPGQGYVGQGLGIADVLAALYFHELRYNPQDLAWVRPRPLSAFDRALLDRALGGARRMRHPADRRAHHLRRRRQPARDEHARHDAGRRDDRRVARAWARAGRRHGARPAPCATRRGGSSSNSRMARCRRARPGRRRCPAASFRLDNLVALIDCNGIQADGKVVLDMEPVAEKWRAFGWETQEIDGNDMDAIVAALHAARADRWQAARDRAPHAAGQGRADAREAREGAFHPRRCRANGTISAPNSNAKRS